MMFSIYVCGHDNGRVRNTCCHISLSRSNKNGLIFWFQFHLFLQHEISFDFSIQFLHMQISEIAYETPNAREKLNGKRKHVSNAMEHFFVIFYYSRTWMAKQIKCVLLILSKWSKQWIRKQKILTLVFCYFSHSFIGIPLFHAIDQEKRSFNKIQMSAVVFNICNNSKLFLKIFGIFTNVHECDLGWCKTSKSLD